MASHQTIWSGLGKIPYFKHVFYAGSILSFIWLAYKCIVAVQLPMVWDLQKQWMLIAVLAMVPVNWLLEALKLRQGLLQDWTIRKCLGIVLRGLATGLLFPIGGAHWAGRVLSVPAEQSVQVLRISLLSSWGQTFSNVFMGLILGFGSYHLLTDWVSPTQIFLILSLSVVVGVVGINMLNRISLIQGLLNRIFKKTLFDIYRIKPKTMLVVFLLSWIRYLVYGLQYFIMVQIFTGLGPKESIQAVSLILLIQSLVYLPTVFQGLLRGGIGAWVFGKYGLEYEVGSSLAILMFWINIIFPALPGCYTLFKEINNEKISNY